MNAYVLSDKGAGQGIPIPVLIWGVVVMCLAFIVNRTRFGRYVYAIGGNPEGGAAGGDPGQEGDAQAVLLLAGMVTVAAVVQVSRLNAGTNSLGTSMELYVIAAAVIGGVALSAGAARCSLGAGRTDRAISESGLLLLDVSIGYRMVIIGQVLIAAVVFDVLYRRAAGERMT